LASTHRRASSARSSKKPWARSHLIPSSVVRAFHARPRKNFAKYKDYDKALLEQLMGKLPIRPPIWTKLRPHQKISFLIGAALGRFAFFLDTGMGKTLLAIALQRYFRKLKKLNGFCLVLVPNRANKAEWKREIKKHSPLTRSLVLRGSSINKWEQLTNAVDPHIVIETYAGLSRMLTKSMEIKKGRRKGKMRLQFDRAKVKRLRTMIAMLVMDESTLVKNKRSLAFRFCDHVSKHIKFVFGMTGTPFGADIEDLQPQMLIIDRGYTLGATLALFRAAFFDQKEGAFAVEYTFDKKKEKLLHEYLAHSSITFEADEADLPELVPVLEYVTLPKDAAQLYDDAKQKLIAAHGNYQEQKNAFVRLRQLSSGWLGYKDDETGKRAQFEFKPNPKLDMLLAKIQEVPRNKKIIVFHDYIYTGAMIARELKKLSIKHLRIYGATDDAEAVLEQFDKDKSVQVLVLNNAAGGFGLNLQIAQYGMFYEVPASLIMGRQTVRRFQRQFSQHKTVFRYDFVCRGTYDQQILDHHAAGRKIFDAIIHDRRDGWSRRSGSNVARAA
jgi:SNF2 family DNA or RNA helicase